MKHTSGKKVRLEHVCFVEVYMEPSALGNEPLVQSWVERLPSTFKPEMGEKLQQLMLDFTLPMIRTVRKQTQEPSMTVDNNICESHFRLLDCYFMNYIPTEARTPSGDEITKLQSHLVPLYFFTLVWSVGLAALSSDLLKELFRWPSRHV